MLEILEETKRRCTRSLALSLWLRLKEAEPEALAELVSPLDDAEQLVLFTALTLFYPERGPAAAKAWLPRARGSLLERRLYLRRLSDRVVRAIAPGLSV